MNRENRNQHLLLLLSNVFSEVNKDFKVKGFPNDKEGKYVSSAAGIAAGITQDLMVHMQKKRKPFTTGFRIIF